MSWCPQPLVWPCSSIRPMLRITETTLRDVEAAGRAMGLQIQIFNASTSREIDAAFATFAARAARRPLRRRRSLLQQPAGPIVPPGGAPRDPRDIFGA